MGMLQDLLGRLRNIRHEADWIGIREVKETTRNCIARNGKVEKNTTSMDHGCMVEVLVDGHFAYYAAPNMTLEALQYACDRATYLARHTAAWKTFSAGLDHRPPAVGQYQTIVHLPLNKNIAADVVGILIEATQKMKVSDK